MTIEIANGLNKGITFLQIHIHLMVGELFPLHNLEILGDILINFEPLFKHLLRKIITTLKKKKNNKYKNTCHYNDNTKHKLQLTFTMYTLPIFLKNRSVTTFIKASSE